MRGEIYLCVKSREDAKWLYGTNRLYDKCNYDVLMISADELRDLYMKLDEDNKCLYETTEADTKSGNGIPTSRDQKMGR